MNPFTEVLYILERDGWTKGLLINLDGERCIRGAIRCNGLSGYELALLDFLAVVLEKLGYERAYERGQGDASVYVTRWNDARERTFEDVKLALKHAAYEWDLQCGI